MWNLFSEGRLDVWLWSSSALPDVSAAAPTGDDGAYGCWGCANPCLPDDYKCGRGSPDVHSQVPTADTMGGWM